MAARSSSSSTTAAMVTGIDAHELPVDQAVPIGTRLQLRAKINHESGEAHIIDYTIILYNTHYIVVLFCSVETRQTHGSLGISRSQEPKRRRISFPSQRWVS